MPPAASSGVAGRPRGISIEAIWRICSGMPELHLLAADLHAVVVDLRLGEARVDEAERDRVDVDLELAPLLGDRFRQADDARLAGGVVGLAGVAERARGRGDVDDLAEHLAAFLALLLGGLAQVRRGRADDPEGDDRVDVEHRLEVLVGHLVHGRVDRVAGVVDDDVDLAERVDGASARAGRARRAWSGRPRTPPSRPAISLAACWATSPSRSLISTCAPCETSSSAVARPIPRAEPVTIAALPSSTPITAASPCRLSLLGREVIRLGHCAATQLAASERLAARGRRGGRRRGEGDAIGPAGQAVMMTPKSCV